MRDPLIDLHCHLEGSIDPQRSYEILHRAGHPMAQEREAFLGHVTTYEPGWDGFSAAVSLLDRCMVDRATAIEVVADVVARAAEQDVKILEPTFAPGEFKLRKALSGDLRPFTEAVIAGVEAGIHNRDIAVGLRMLILPRHLSDPFCDTYGDVIEHVLEYRRHLVGVDICTLDRIQGAHDERRLRALCDRVQASGLHLTAHAGEFYDAAPVVRALGLGAERIGHGIQVAYDVAVLEQVKAGGVTLEVCPVSNYRTGALARGCEHPLAGLLRAGVRVTINSDDSGVQGSTWQDDYRMAVDRIGLTEDEVRQCLRNAYQASFLRAEDKGKYAGLWL